MSSSRDETLHPSKHPPADSAKAVDAARFSTAEAQHMLPPAGTQPRSAVIYEHGSMLLKLFAPRDQDPQTPHTRDELYFVTQGNGWFVRGDHRHRFESGDVLFVPAGMTHRFEEFSDDLAVWVVFYGPEGGEAA